MTMAHVVALRKAVEAHKAVTDALDAESKRIADERAKAASGDMAVHNTQNTTGSKGKGNA